LCHVFQGNYDERVRAALSKGQVKKNDW